MYFINDYQQELLDIPVEWAEGSLARSADIDLLSEASRFRDSSRSPGSIDLERILERLNRFLIVPKKSRLFFLLLPLSATWSNQTWYNHTTQHSTKWHKVGVWLSRGGIRYAGVRSEVLTVMLLTIKIFWVVMLCGLMLQWCWGLNSKCCPGQQGFEFRVLLNAFINIQCTKASGRWRINFPY